MKQQETNFSRRHFIGTMAAAGTIMVACSGKSAEKVKWYNQPRIAPDGPELKAGLIGCGGRGTGAAVQFLSAGPKVKITALADVFDDRLQSCRARILKEKNNEVADENCFIGFDAYEKLIDSGVDVVLIATPPHFRPIHFAAAVAAKKHVFMEKPVAVDPVGARSIMATAKKAEALGLTVVTGTQRRHQREYIATFKQVKSGAIGDIAGINVYWNGGQLWYRTRQRGWSDMEWAIRDWVNWCWLSGDHIVEQHVHNLDVANWFTGSHPVKALGFGARQRRVTGDQYDMFSVDFVYPDGFHMHSMCRQINGCTNNVSEFIMGTKGSTNCRNTIFERDGKTQVWKYGFEKDKDGNEIKDKSPYYQEHIDFVTAIRTNNPINEAENTAISTMTAIMGRISAYTGKAVTWEEMMNSDLRLGPKEYRMGALNMQQIIPVPGTEKRPKKA